MPAVARGNSEDDVSCNHPCLGTTKTNGMSDDVIVNGIGVHREGDDTVVHVSGVDSPICVSTHAPVIAEGSTSVFANGKGVARVGDDYTASDKVSTASGNGSPDVFAGP